MFRVCTLSFILTIFGMQAHALEWREIAGCYQTVAYNNIYLENSYRNYSVINLSENPLFFISVDEEEYVVHTAVLYKGDSNYHYQDIYFEDGSNSNNRGLLKNDFKSYVRYRFSPDKVIKLTSQFSARHVDGNTYEVISFKNIEFAGETFLESGRFVLEKVDCYDDIETEELFSRGIELPFELEL
ncbi:hypothetical protein [Halobacteriovorax marinus]|uniref:hypothetical protein n=1 Tax=Halobacteriovorax marinus TaxID=97084 RepID=UPI003A942901